MSAEKLKVPSGLYWQSRLVKATENLWRGLGNLESGIVRDELEEISIESPVYVTSLARAGTTIVTEMLNQHEDTTAHRYSDFPWVWTPYWRNYLRQRAQLVEPKLEERAHKDRILVSTDSPEAVEEVLWNHFFPQTHDPQQSNILDRQTTHPAFEKFYAEHLQKLLLVRKAKRYLAKGNYNIGRLAYIKKLMPSARFIIPVRNPYNHIASLVKQHQFFLQAAKADPRIGQQLQFAGHWEFGPGRRLVNYADVQAVEAIKTAWGNGDEILGWTWLWRSTYAQLFKQLEADPELRDACYIFQYEELCADSGRIIDEILSHSKLNPANYTSQRTEYIEKLSLPDYYQPNFTATQKATIAEVCGDIAATLGYSI
ncbi:MAG: sulfotransferase [Xanthomonadales bacterium]|nr:sulfotransferase [Xanthomonadales bacterium]